MTTEQPKVELKDKLVLIVDDEARMRSFMQMNLELEGCRGDYRSQWQRGDRQGTRGDARCGAVGYYDARYGWL
ncbi:MAG: hypothetical protein KatS3mg057_0766 [Herpetosiphonaceae bacterium]|nr:MAG: hypothetical protein KatS3mg057_0766 [Herpetosiphonaceae bacterium]